MITTAQRMGIAVRGELNEPEGLEPYLKLGINDFNVGVDVKTLFSWFCKSGAIMRRELVMKPVVKSPTSPYGS